MTAPSTSGAWRQWARMRRNGHVVTVTLHRLPSGAVYVVALNDSARRSFPSWRDALEYGAHVLAISSLTDTH